MPQHHSRRGTPQKLIAILSRWNSLLGRVVGYTPEPQQELNALIPVVGRKKRLKTKTSPEEKQLRREMKQMVRESKRDMRREKRKKITTKLRALATPNTAIICLNLAVLAILVAGFTWRQPGSETPTEQVERNAANALQSSIERYLPLVSSGDLDAFGVSSTTIPRQAWVAPWNAEALASRVDRFSSVSAFWLTVNQDGATLSTKGDWQVWRTFAEKLPPGTERYVTVSGDPDYSYLVLASPETQASFITNLTDTARAENFTGVDINFEMLGSENRELFTTFIRNLSAVARSKNLSVSVTVEARIGNAVPMDWRTLGMLADEIRVMAYDYHSRLTGRPGPVAPLGWVQEVVAFAVQQVPASKLVIGLGNYGYHWRAPFESGGSWEGVGISYERANQLAGEVSAPILTASGPDFRGYEMGGIPNFSYTDSEGRIREVWFENEESLNRKLNALQAFNVRGVIFWNVGLGDSDLWVDPTRPKAYEDRTTAIPTPSPTPSPTPTP